MKSKVDQIVKEVEELSEPELVAFLDQVWDIQFARDVARGKLERLGDEALAEHRAGLTRPL
jgi:hypothetical protein